MATTKPRTIFPNLPVGDLERSKELLAALGFGFDPQFTDDTATHTRGDAGPLLREPGWTPPPSSRSGPRAPACRG